MEIFMFYNFVKTKFGTFTLIWKENRLLKLNFPSSTPMASLNNCTGFSANIKKQELDQYVGPLSTQLTSYLECAKPINIKFKQSYDSVYSDFQKDIFDLVKLIPLGQTKSYLEISQELGYSNGARAVGQALKKNLTPLFIPCHRVVASNGALIGYSPQGGTFWQAFLLYRETGLNFSNILVHELVQGSDHIAQRDSKLKKVIQFHGPPALFRNDSATFFQILVRTIVGQQLSVKAAQSIFMKLSKTLNYRITPKRILLSKNKDLKDCGLSTKKIDSIKRVADLFINNYFPSNESLKLFSDDQIDDLLIKIKGIGRWTCDVIKLFYLRRLDTFPSGDLGVKKGFKKFYGVDIDSKKGIAITDKWSPYRGVASWYLWRLNDYNISDLRFVNDLD